jgi:hypothetical protein
MKRLLALALAFIALPAAATGRLVDIVVIDRSSGVELPLYPHRGRLHVPGDPGARYSVLLVNRTPERVLAVLSVDGINAITGQTAAAQQSGYVLAPYGRTEVRGWRKNLHETAEFYFTELPDSYAARTDRPENVGVIGLAVFRERVWYPRPQAPEIARGNEQRWKSEPAPEAGAQSRDAAPAPSESQSKSWTPGRSQELGTGHGERRWDPARTTEFVRRSNRPDEVIALYYDSYDALADAGIVPNQRRRWSREPEPFPLGFAPDPYR